nr:hypothetical protein [uncultured Desulfuromonas sp.]
MKRTATIVCFVVAAIFAAELSHASLSGFMSDVNVRARADLRDFSVRLSSRFAVPVPDVDGLLRRVSAPADAFMCLQLSHMSRVPLEQVMERYRQRHDKGWGQLAQELGIKPGSAEFHRIRQGEFVLYDNNGNDSGRDKKQGKGQGKNTPDKGKGQGKNSGGNNR